ncbi:MAG: type II toxin-antitoxin system VapC family toxin [Pseudomonadota bacterium]
MNGLLLDTHALLWFAAGDRARMPADVAALIADPEHDVYVSAASIWEIATKVRLGKLTGAEDIAARPHYYISELGLAGLSITIDHAGRAGLYDVAHRDPFDRMLAAQSEIEGLALVSVDTALDAFGIQRVWPNPPTQP